MKGAESGVNDKEFRGTPAHCLTFLCITRIIATCSPALPQLNCGQVALPRVSCWIPRKGWPHVATFHLHVQTHSSVNPPRLAATSFLFIQASPRSGSSAQTEEHRSGSLRSKACSQQLAESVSGVGE